MSKAREEGTLTSVIRSAAGGFSLICLLAAACSGIESRTYSFATLAEAREAGAIEQGLVPEGLPPGTREIRQAYVPGTAQRWGIINFPPEEGDVLRAMLDPDELPLDGYRCDIPARIEWWPIVLRGSLDDERIRLTGLRAYRTQDGALIFAVNWSQGRAYYWPG